MQNTTFGQYYYGDSLVHKLDPRVKLFGTIVFSTTIFLVSNFLGYALVLLFTALFIFLSQVPVTHIVKTVSSALLFAIFISFFQIFVTEGNPVAIIWKFTITDQGLITAGILSFRLIILVLGTSIITFCTTPKDLTDGMEKGLHILKKARVPIHEMAMAMFIAIRFIPVLSEEFKKIRTAQISRGADFDSGGLFKRIISLVSLIIPLLVSAFQRAFDLSIAMESRCYDDAGNRTKMYPFLYSSKDYVAYVIILLFFVLAIISTRIH
jgi:energy-coupling factor transport system permease protein